MKECGEIHNGVQSVQPTVKGSHGIPKPWLDKEKLRKKNVERGQGGHWLKNNPSNVQRKGVSSV